MDSAPLCGICVSCLVHAKFFMKWLLRIFCFWQSGYSNVYRWWYHLKSSEPQPSKLTKCASRSRVDYWLLGVTIIICNRQLGTFKLFIIDCICHRHFVGIGHLHFVVVSLETFDFILYAKTKCIRRIYNMQLINFLLNNFLWG